ncbi:hypothetical protein LTS15_002988 [Exophiala xenobiotica]|nr:hypothetical protein LTS15_002988 [Exophiala xenobiotica]
MAESSPPELTEWHPLLRTSADYDLVSPSVSPISISELLDISDNRGETEGKLALNNFKLGDDESPVGSVEFRKNLASLYSARSAGVTQDHIIITNGTSSSNYTVFAALLSPGDHVVCQYPVDGLLYETLASLGAEAALWEAEPAKRWQLDLDELKKLIKDNTKMIVINSPCNPTGAVVSKPKLETLFEIAEEKGIFILADESYRPLFHSISPSDEDFPPSAINMGYSKVIVTGTISQAYSLPGIKAGWVASKNKEILDACRKTGCHLDLSASKLDQAVAAEALNDRCIHTLLGRNIRLCQTNLELLQGFIEEHSWACSWVKPLAGTTAMLKFHKMGKPVDDAKFCLALLKEAGLSICPASTCFGDGEKYRGYVRVAFGVSTSQFKPALAAWTSFMEENYDSVPTSSRK